MNQGEENGCICLQMFPSGSLPASTTTQTSHGIWRWGRQVALTSSREAELEGLHQFQPCRELQGSHETQAEQMEQRFLE